MRRLLLSCVASLALYGAAFGFVLDRPLSLGQPRALLDAKLARGASLTPTVMAGRVPATNNGTIPRFRAEIGPRDKPGDDEGERPSQESKITAPGILSMRDQMGRKLVILAGSGGPYSHRCETIEPILGVPCVNAGVAVGIGLDYLFARWQPLLHPGDIVYLPLEEAQYMLSPAASRLGPDAAIMLRHDWGTLARLPPDRWAAAFFAFDARALVMSLIEMTLVSAGFHDPREAATGGTNAWGDHVGHTAAMAEANQAMLALVTPQHASAHQVETLTAGRQVGAFLDWARDHGVRAIGGFPVGFDDTPIPEATKAAIRTLFETHGAGFLDLAPAGRYPRRDFFDTADHLHETAQIAHSVSVARALRATAEAESPPRR
jgi:hypothetical protein